MIQHHHPGTAALSQLLRGGREPLCPSKAQEEWGPTAPSLGVPEPHTGRDERRIGSVGRWRRSSREKADAQPSPELGGKPVTPPGRALGVPHGWGLYLQGDKGAGHAEEAARAVSATASNSIAGMGHRLERHEEQSCPIAAISCTCIEAVPFPAGTRFYTGPGGDTHQLFQMFPHAANDTLDGQCRRALGHSPCPVEICGGV